MTEDGSQPQHSGSTSRSPLRPPAGAVRLWQLVAAARRRSHGELSDPGRGGRQRHHAPGPAPGAAGAKLLAADQDGARAMMEEEAPTYEEAATIGGVEVDDDDGGE